MSVVYVTTAVALTEELRQQIRLVAAKKIGHKDFSLEERIDPTVIGGLKLSLSGRVYDASVAQKLQQLRNA